jgi:ribonuclease T
MSDADLTVAAGISAATCASAPEGPDAPGAPGEPKTSGSSDEAGATAGPQIGSAQTAPAGGPVIAIEPAASGTGPALTIGVPPTPASAADVHNAAAPSTAGNATNIHNGANAPASNATPPEAAPPHEPTAPAPSAPALSPATAPSSTNGPVVAALPPTTTAPPAVPNGLMARRFRGFLPVVIDVETGGFHSATDALLEIAAVLIDIEPDGTLKRGATHSFHVKPFEGARLDPAALSITGIDPFHPLRPALPEKDALGRVFREIRHAVHAHNCRRAILVGHNAAFDLGFLNAAVVRADVKRNPFHPFSCFDTATLAGAALGQTVLAKALAVAGLQWDPSSAHSAAYDAERTADIFCVICNRLHDSFRDAQDRARSMGWFNAAPAEPAADEPPL